MGRWKGLAFALLAASCAKTQGVKGPAPVPAPVPSVRTPSSDSSEAQKATKPAPHPQDSVPAAVSVALDSAARLKAARDSALDAAMLERIAEAKPPVGTELVAAPTEAESATLKDLFDIDVANFEDHGRVKYWVDFFTGPARERMAIWLERMPRYEPVFRARLTEKGLPGDLAFLPLIESGYSPTAVSRARAVGMWQFMRATGRFYGLTVDAWVDERRDVSKATAAAVRYLGDLTQRFGSAYLAAAAYNGGPGRIQRGLNRLDLNDDDEPADNDSTVADGSPLAGDLAFFQLADSRYIRKETKDYVPKLIAAAMIAKQPDRYGFTVPMGGPLALDSVVVLDATGLDVVAGLAGVPVAELRELNPHYLRELTPPKRTAVVRLPAGKAGPVLAALEALSPSARMGSFPHPARSGETLTSLANHYGVTLAAIREANPDYAARAPRKGEVVKIPGEARLKGWVGANRKMTLAELGEGAVRHRVRKGETIGGIARRYRVSVSQLKAWNGLRSNMVRVGQVLRLNPGNRRAVPVRARTSAESSMNSAASKVHLVKTGDTLSSLARRYGTTIQALRTANNLTPGRALLRGQRLKIPS